MMVKKNSGSQRTASSQNIPFDGFRHEHRDVSGGSARAAVFGASDGLVSNVSLILGVAGAASSAPTVLLSGIAGLVAGAFSMAVGEYLSMSAQKELLERELALEAIEIEKNYDLERAELAGLYRRRGLDKEVADHVAEVLMKDPVQALEVHAREEMGINPESLGSPVTAALFSFFAFAMGALLPLIPWMVSGGTAAIVASAVVALVAASVLGFALAIFSERAPLKVVGRQVGLTVLSCAATYGVGLLFGSAVA